MRSARGSALMIAATFGAIGVVWVLVMDVLTYTASSDPVMLGKLQIAVDWVFVLIASAVLYVAVHREAARLNRACAMLSSVVDSVGDGLVLLGRDRKIVYANPTAVKMLRCESASELIGLDAVAFARRFLVTYPSGALVTPDAFASQRAFQAAGPLHYQCVLHPSNTEELVIDATAAPVRSRPDRTPAMVVSMMHDVTDSEHLAELRDRFFAAAAHTLKTPVAIIKANVQFLERSGAAGGRTSFVAIERQCNRIDRLVRNLQIIARARSHSLRLHLHDIDLAPLVRQTAHDLVSSTSALDVRIEIAAMPRVRGDRERLSTMLLDLTYEALHASRLRTPLTLTLTLRDDRAELSVRYEALAIAERTFVGLEKYDDTAIGRCAIQTIVEAHGGELGEHVSGSEALLWVRLPTIEETHDPEHRHLDRG